MKKIALLLLVLPLPAYASSEATVQLRQQQASEARDVCTANNQGPGSSDYGKCVNTYLASHYGWQVVHRADGSLGVGFPKWRGTPSYY